MGTNLLVASHLTAPPGICSLTLAGIRPSCQRASNDGLAVMPSFTRPAIMVSILARSNPRVVFGVVKFDQAFQLPLQGYFHPCLKLPPPPVTAVCYAEYLLRTRQP